MKAKEGSEQAYVSWDGFGVFASSACAVHCVICSLIPGALAAVGLGALIGHKAEWVLTLVAVAFAGIAAYLGWKKHASHVVVVTLSLGVFGLLLARGAEMSGQHGAGPVVGVAAGAVLVAGHVANLRASRVEG
jgi:hypothetical protein